MHIILQGLTIIINVIIVNAKTNINDPNDNNNSSLHKRNQAPSHSQSLSHLQSHSRSDTHNVMINNNGNQYQINYNERWYYFNRQNQSVSDRTHVYSKYESKNMFTNKYSVTRAAIDAPIISNAPK